AGTALTLSGSDTAIVTLDAGNLTAGGYTGNITVTAGTGANTITTGSGNDTITGGAGADTLTGGTGNDTYIYSSTTDVTGDNIVEATGGGTDTIRTTATADL